MTVPNKLCLKFLPLLIVMWVSHFLVDIMLGIWPVFKTLADLDLIKAGLVVSIGALIGEGSQLFFGAFSDRGYRKHFIILGLALAAGCSFLSYFSQYGALFGLYLLTCIGSGSFHPSAGGLMSSLVPAQRSLLMTLFASGGCLGMAGSQLIFIFTYKATEGSTWMLAIPLLLMAAFLLFFQFPALPNVPKPDKKPKKFLADFAYFIKQPRLRSLYFLQVANQSILWGTIFILPDVLKSFGHAEWICYGGGHLCFILGGFFTMVPAGYLADKYSARMVLLIAGIVSCAGFYLLIFFGSLSVMVLLSTLFVLGAALNLVNPVGVALGTIFEPTRPGSISAFLMGLVWCISEALGPGGVGALTYFFDDYAPVKALAVLGSLFLIQIYATCSLPSIAPEASVQTSPEMG